jgi:VanZ family protein
VSTVQRAIFPLVLMAILFVVSTIPGQAHPGDSDFVWLVSVTPKLLQKSMHVVLYAILAWLWVWTLRPLRLRLPAQLVLAVAITVAFGATMEVFQTTIPGRFGTLNDVFINGLGAAIGLIAAFFLS